MTNMARARALGLALTAVVAGMFWLGSPAKLSGQEAGGKSGSAYDKLDEGQLARALQSFGMTELLEALAKSTPAKIEDVGRASVLIQAKLGEVSTASQPADKQRLLKEVLQLQEQAVEATKKATDHKELYRHYRLTLERVVTEGITMVDPYAERVFYLQSRPQDYATILELTGPAIKILDRLVDAMQRMHEGFSEDDRYMVDGTATAMEELMAEARYRGAWVRLYRALAMDKGTAEREGLLRQVISDVAEFANAEDNSSGVKHMSLLMSGMAERELGELDKARTLLERANNKEAGERWQLRALFELCHAEIELGPPEKAEDALKSFAENGLKIAASPSFMGANAQVAIDMQSTLLRSHFYSLRAEAAKNRKDAAAEKEAQTAALKTLLAFTEKYPDFKKAFIDVIAPKYDGQPIERIPMEMLMPLAYKNYQEETQESLVQAEKYAQYALDKQTDPKKKAEAMWLLCWVRNQQGKLGDKGRLFEAARLFREFAERYREDENAGKAVLYAVGNLRGVMTKADKSRAIDVQPAPDFAQEYVRALEAAVTRAQADDPLLPSFYYELGKTYEDLGRSADAIVAFNLIPPRDELYIPSRYRVLKNSVTSLRSDTKLSLVQRQPKAEALINDLKNYREQAAKYIAATQDEDRKKQVQDWAVDCDVLVAELLSDPLGKPQEAIAYAWDIIKRWPGQAELEQNCKDLIVRSHLARGELGPAIKVVEEMAKPDTMLAVVIQRMITRMEELEWTPGPEARKQLQDMLKNYVAFARKLSEKPPKGVPEYSIQQALAGGFERSGEDVAKALEMYEKLVKEKPSDATNIRGLARCYAKMKKYDPAREMYRKLILGLPERSPEWWRIWVEYLRFMLEAYPKDVAALKSVTQDIKLLWFKDPTKVGGLSEYLNDINAKANEMLKAAGG